MNDINRFTNVIYRLINGIGRSVEARILLLVSIGTNLIVGQLWHESLVVGQLWHESYCLDRTMEIRNR